MNPTERLSEQMAPQKCGPNDLSEGIISYLEDNGIRIESFIAEGGFSNVYKAVSGHNEVAVKVIQLKEKQKNLRQEILENEVQISSAVKHENIMRTNYVLELKNDYLFIISDFADGGDLITILDKNIELKEELIMRWFSHIVKAVEYLHLSGIAHRDIKPDNVLIHKEVAKLSDFGYAKVCVDGNGKVVKTCDACGTLEYLSPEQIVCLLDDEPYDPFVADCYSLGVLLFMLVEPDFPYQCSGESESDAVLERLLYKQLKQKWKLKGRYGTNQNVISLLRQLLHPDVSARITCFQILSHPWIKNFVQHSL